MVTRTPQYIYADYQTNWESSCICHYREVGVQGSSREDSMLHHFFAHHGLGEKTVHLHADNCGGQNKNAIMVQYQLWRVMTNQHSKITLYSMIPGHKKLCPEWCFGLLKKWYWWTKVGGLSDLCGVVNDSAAVNIAQPTGPEDGSVVVTTSDFSQICTKVKGIKKLHHLKDKNKADQLPPVLPPTGLSLQQQ